MVYVVQVLYLPLSGCCGSPDIMSTTRGCIFPLFSLSACTISRHHRVTSTTWRYPDMAGDLVVPTTTFICSPRHLGSGSCRIEAGAPVSRIDVFFCLGMKYMVTYIDRVRTILFPAPLCSTSSSCCCVDVLIVFNCRLAAAAIGDALLLGLFEVVRTTANSEEGGWY